MSVYYSSPPDTSYLLMKPFTMPTESGPVWAVAFSRFIGTLLTAVFAVVLVIMFSCFWHFVCFMAVLFGGDHDKRQDRFEALVTVWNSDDSLLAFKRMLGFTYYSLYPEKKDPNVVEVEQRPQRSWADFVYGSTFSVVAISIYVGGVVLGIIAPSLIEIGHTAPVRPSFVFYPDSPRTDEQRLADFGLRAPGALRAIGSIEAGRPNVKIDAEMGAMTPDGLMASLEYSYSFTGVDLGLQHAGALRSDVRGYCTTEYGWWAGEVNGGEVYYLWKDPTMAAVVPLNVSDIRYAPRATMMTPPLAVEQLKKDSNVSFAVVIGSAHRSSITPGSDPWYLTERRDEDLPPAPYNASFWIRTKRPTLSCWQQDRWSYKGARVASVLDLAELPGLRLPAALRSVMVNAFAVPMVVRLGNTIGDSSLRSRTTSPRGVIDAGKSTLESDMERLIVAGYIASLNVFSETTSFGNAGFIEYPNVLEGEDGLPAEGAGDFVVVSADVTTFDLVGLIVIAALFALLLLHAWVSAWIIKSHCRKAREDSIWARFKLLAASDLLDDANKSNRAREAGGPPPESDRSGSPTTNKVLTSSSHELDVEKGKETAV